MKWDLLGPLPHKFICCVFFILKLRGFSPIRNSRNSGFLYDSRRGYVFEQHLCGAQACPAGFSRSSEYAGHDMRSIYSLSSVSFTSPVPCGRYRHPRTESLDQLLQWGKRWPWPGILSVQYNRDFTIPSSKIWSAVLPLCMIPSHTITRYTSAVAIN